MCYCTGKAALTDRTHGLRTQHAADQGDNLRVSERRDERLEIGHFLVRLACTGLLLETPHGKVALGLRQDTGVVRVFGLPGQRP